MAGVISAEYGPIGVRTSVEPSLDAASYPFSQRIRVRFAETDAMGIVHHSRYLLYFEEARVAFLRHVGHPYDEVRAEGVEMAVLEAFVQYRKPLEFDDVFDVHVTIAALERVTFQMAYLLTVGRRGPRNGRHRARMHHVRRQGDSDAEVAHRVRRHDLRLRRRRSTTWSGSGPFGHQPEHGRLGGDVVGSARVPHRQRLLLVHDVAAEAHPVGHRPEHPPVVDGLAFHPAFVHERRQPASSGTASAGRAPGGSVGARRSTPARRGRAGSPTRSTTRAGRVRRNGRSRRTPHTHPRRAGRSASSNAQGTTVTALRRPALFARRTFNAVRIAFDGSTATIDASGNAA